MKSITLKAAKGKNSAEVKLYATLYEITSLRWKELQKWRLMDSGIGGDQEAITMHEERIAMFEQAGETTYANQEKLHLHNCRFLIEKGIKPRNRAFACLVDSIGNKTCNDLSGDGLDGVLSQLTAMGMTGQQIDEMLTDIIKNMEQERKYIDPENPIESPEESCRDELYRQCMAACDFIITDDPVHLQTMNEVHEWFIKTLRPPSLNLNSPYNQLSEMDRQYAQLSAWLRTEGIQDPDRLTVFDMQQHLQFFQKRYEKQQQKHL